VSAREHSYEVRVDWCGDRGPGTSAYRAYSRDHRIAVGTRVPIPGSSDAVFRGDPQRYNPEELLVAALSACHMLSYLHLCADAGVVVRSYSDQALGVMREDGGGGRFQQVTLQPRVGVDPGADAALALALHERAHANCFIASSVNFPVLCRPQIAPCSAGQA